MRPSPLGAHRWNDAAGEIVPAEDVRLELGAKHLRPDILERARLAVSAIVEQRDELSVRRREHMRGRGGNRVRLGIVEIEALDPNLILQTGDVFRLARAWRTRASRAPSGFAPRKARCPTSSR